MTTIMLPVPLPRLTDTQVLDEIKRLAWEHKRLFGDCQRAQDDLDRADGNPELEARAGRRLEYLEGRANQAYDAWDMMRCEARRRGLEVGT